MAEPHKVVSDLVEFLGIDKQRVDEFLENYHYHWRVCSMLYESCSITNGKHTKYDYHTDYEINYPKTQEFVVYQLQVLLSYIVRIILI